jgi:hypothetical protein
LKKYGIFSHAGLETKASITTVHVAGIFADEIASKVANVNAS